MKIFKTKIFETREAFFDTLMQMEDKEEATRVFANMLNKESYYEKEDFMFDYLAENNEFYSAISDELRKVFELDAGAYYVEN